MQCEVRSMNEERAPAQAESQPRQGFVNQVCREWLVHEDGALAQKLQKEEIEMHYGKNRSERRVVQQDLKQAKNLQEEELMETQKIQQMYDQMLIEQELADAEVALQLQHLEDQKGGRTTKYEEADQRLAHQLQEKERQRYERKSKVVEKEKKPIERSRVPISEPLPERASEFLQTREYTTSSNHTVVTETFDPSDLSDFCLKPTPDMDDPEARRLREEQDAELARLLQEQESKRGGIPDRDRLLAIEAQDRELAKLLQEQERAKVRRAKERARLKALQKQQMAEEAANTEAETQGSLQRPSDIPGLVPKHKDTPGVSIKKSRPPGGGGINKPSHDTPRHLPAEEEQDNTTEHANIAIAIDPTYNRRLRKNANLTSSSRPPPDGSGSSGSTPVLPSPDCSRTGGYEDDEHCYDSDEGPAPPYMPIQGQKRQTLEKKKKGKENCRQQ